MTTDILFFPTILISSLVCQGHESWRYVKLIMSIVVFRLCRCTANVQFQLQIYNQVIPYFFQKKADGSIQIFTQMVEKGDIQPEKQIVIDAVDIRESFPSANDFSLDLNGESLRVVTIPVLLF